MSTVAAKTSFYHLAVLLDKIQKLTGTDQKKKLLKEFIAEWRKFHSSLHADDPNTVRITMIKCEMCLRNG